MDEFLPAPILLAGLAVAARQGLEMEDALDLARKLYVDVNIFSSNQNDVRDRLSQLPGSCWESAESLLREREVYQRDSVFPPIVIDEIVKKLKNYDDRELSERLHGNESEIKKLVDTYLQCLRCTPSLGQDRGYIKIGSRYPQGVWY